jgi:hypothetical protein
VQNYAHNQPLRLAYGVIVSTNRQFAFVRLSTHAVRDPQHLHLSRDPPQTSYDVPVSTNVRAIYDWPTLDVVFWGGHLPINLLHCLFCINPGHLHISTYAATHLSRGCLSLCLPLPSCTHIDILLFIWQATPNQNHSLCLVYPNISVWVFASPCLLSELFHSSGLNQADC